MGSARLQKDGVAVFLPAPRPLHRPGAGDPEGGQLLWLGGALPHPAHPLGELAGAGEGPADRRSMVLRDDGPK